MLFKFVDYSRVLQDTLFTFRRLNCAIYWRGTNSISDCQCYCVRLGKGEGKGRVRLG